MRIIHQPASNNPKLCNLEPGTLVMAVDASDGSEAGPFILMSCAAYAHVTHQAMRAREDTSTKVAGTVAWKDGSDARLLDPKDGQVYIVHASSRGRVLKNAALLINANEEG